jgi:hypothetical protein
VGATVKITDRDKGAAKLIAALLEKGALSVGILGEDGGESHGDLTVAEVAEFHEFGLGNNPRRSFLADWVTEKHDEIRNVVIKGGQSLVRRQIPSVSTLLEQFGAWADGSIQKRIADQIPPPLSEETIARKGSSVPLIDTGQLRSSISYRVDQGALAGSE